MAELTGKRAIITGAASGIGRATAELFVAEGARVIIADVSDESGKNLAKELGASAAYFRTDVSDASQVAAVVDFAVAQWGGLGLMFNNAGIAESMEKVAFLDDDFERFNKVIAVDLLGPLLGCKYAGLAMRASGSGAIINNASIGGLHAGFGMPIYRAAKAAVIHMTRNCAIELGSYGIRVNSISPGPIETPLAAAGFPPAVAAQISSAASKLMTDMQILKRTGKAVDIANAAVFLASDRAAQITGQNLVVDGGASIGDKVDQVALMQAEFKNLLS